MINAEEIARAEQTLRVVYTGDLGRQLAALQIDRAAFDNVIQHCWAGIDKNYRQARSEMDPRLEPAINTMMGHMFLLGVVAGGNQQREIV